MRRISLQSSRRERAAVFAGGFLGAVARAELGDALATDPLSWPWATFIVNVAGAFLLGWFITRLQERLPPSSFQRPLLGTGF
jgi:CrcB protein